jgi:hypothetical protein
MVLASEFESDGRLGGRRRDAAILSYEPGVVDTPMQGRARSGAKDVLAWSRPFRDFAEQGMLERPADLVGEIVAFLSSDRAPGFEERRFDRRGVPGG